MEHTIKPAQAGNRLDVVVASLYPQFTRSALEILFNKQMVTVNHKAAKGSYKVKLKDKISIDETYLKTEPQPINLPIIYEDENIIVIDKPPGLLTHSKGALNLEPTVASFIKDKIKDKQLTGNRAGIVHRLDRGTSGVLVAAKNMPALKYLQKQFSDRKVKKEYLAIVEGSLNPEKAVIEAPIARNPRRPQTFAVQGSGKSAITRYETVKAIKKDGKHYTVVKLEPKTGRTHQLRLHLAYIGYPIVGDQVYGRGNNSMLLHAQSLGLSLPGGINKVFEAKLPASFKDFMDYD